MGQFAPHICLKNGLSNIIAHGNSALVLESFSLQGSDHPTFVAFRLSSVSLNIAFLYQAIAQDMKEKSRKGTI